MLFTMHSVFNDPMYMQMLSTDREGIAELLQEEYVYDVLQRADINLNITVSSFTFVKCSL